MNSKKILQILMIGGGLFLAICAAVTILLNPTGGIAGLSKLITILGILLGITNPKGGLFFLALQAIYSDEIKRIGVYYGVQSSETVSEILIGPLLTLCAINISFLYGILRGQYKIDFMGWVLYMIAPVVAIAMIVTGRDAGLSLNLYLAGTTALYITLIPICYGLFNSTEEWARYLTWQAVAAAPAAAWAIVQYYNGFNTIEMSYALSGLSRVHMLQMMVPEPRVFGLFGSASALGCVGMYGIFCAWRTFRFSKMNVVFFFLTLLYFSVIVISLQRTLLLIPLIVLVFALAFRKISTTLLLYAIVFGVYLSAILSSTYMLEVGLDKINNSISGHGKWSENVLNVSTFSDRMRGWERLTRPETWSLFGTEKSLRSTVASESPDYTADDYSHDIINRVLINFGAVGLVALLGVAGLLIYKLHQVTFRTKDRQVRRDGAFIMACIVPTLILSFMGGDNFTATPINLQIWSIFSGIFILRKISSYPVEQIPSEVPDPTHEASPVLRPRLTRHQL